MNVIFFRLIEASTKKKGQKTEILLYIHRILWTSLLGCNEKKINSVRIPPPPKYLYAGWSHVPNFVWLCQRAQTTLTKIHGENIVLWGHSSRSYRCHEFMWKIVSWWYIHVSIMVWLYQRTKICGPNTK